VLIDGKQIERVNKLYLRSLVTVDSNSTTDIKAKLTNCKTCYSTADRDLESKRKRHGPEETTCTISDMEYRVIRVRKLGAEEVR